MNRKTVFAGKGFHAVVWSLGLREYVIYVYKNGLLVLTQTFNHDVIGAEFKKEGYFVAVLTDLTTVVFDLSAQPGEQEVLRFRSKIPTAVTFAEEKNEMREFSITGLVSAVKKKPWYRQIPKKYLERLKA